MEYPLPSGGWLFPRRWLFTYDLFPTESGDEWVASKLELISKEKNVFGDTVYHIREANGMTYTVFEQELEGYLKRKGVFSLTPGQPFLYPLKNGRT